MSYYLSQPIDRGDSLTPARLKGKDRARKALIAAEDEQKRLLEELVTRVKAGINCLQDIRRAAEFEQRTGSFHGWSSNGEEQGNAARGVDAVVGRLYQNTAYIKLLHDVLEIPIEQRSKHERHQEEEQARPEGAQAEGKEEPEEGKGAGPEPDGERVQRSARRARSGTDRGAKPTDDAGADQGRDRGKPVEGSKAGVRTRKRSSRVAK